MEVHKINSTPAQPRITQPSNYDITVLGHPLTLTALEFQGQPFNVNVPTNGTATNVVIGGFDLRTLGDYSYAGVSFTFAVLDLSNLKEQSAFENLNAVITATETPEPASLFLMGSGLAITAWAARRKNVPALIADRPRATRRAKPPVTLISGRWSHFWHEVNLTSRYRVSAKFQYSVPLRVADGQSRRSRQEQLSLQRSNYLRLIFFLLLPAAPAPLLAIRYRERY